MKEFKGTKGEWKVKDNFREPTILNEDNCVIFLHNKDCTDIDEDLIKYYSHNKMMANVKLAAAAPKLLAAAIKAIEECCDLIGTDAGNSLEKAINKALK